MNVLEKKGMTLHRLENEHEKHNENKRHLLNDAKTDR